MCACGGKKSVPGGGGDAQALAMRTQAAFMATETAAPGAYQEGDILAEILFLSGTPRTASGRQYPVMRKGEQWWVAAEDVFLYPTWFSVVAAEPSWMRGV